MGGTLILPYEKDGGAHRKLLFWKEPLMHQSDVNLSQPPYPGHIGLQRGFITLLAALGVPLRSGIRTFWPEECGALVEICCNPKWRRSFLWGLLGIFRPRDQSRWQTQVFTGICRIRLIVLQISISINLGHGFTETNASIVRCRWIFVLLLHKTKTLNYTKFARLTTVCIPCRWKAFLRNVAKIYWHC